MRIYKREKSPRQVLMRPFFPTLYTQRRTRCKSNLARQTKAEKKRSSACVYIRLRKSVGVERERERESRGKGRKHGRVPELTYNTAREPCQSCLLLGRRVLQLVRARAHSKLLLALMLAERLITSPLCPLNGRRRNSRYKK